MFTKIWGIIFLTTCFNVFAATRPSDYIKNQPAIIHGAFDYEGEALVLDVRYSGGCGRHFFRLEFGGKITNGDFTTYMFKLFDETNDFCEAELFETAVFPINAIKELVDLTKGKTNFVIFGGDTYSDGGVMHTAAKIEY